MSYIGESSSSALSSTIQWKYDVFLSFRGEDTRKNFTDHLYAALDQKGIVTFKDDEELERGKDISSDLLKAIEEAKFSIIVLSKNYASSKWCLDELAKIVECIESKGHMTFPVFHYVDPSDVRKQTGDFEKYFDKHEEEFKENKQKVQRWREAITQVGSFSGWHLRDRHEAKLIQEIVQDIWRRLNQTLSGVDVEYIGMDSRVEQLMSFLDTKLDNEVRFIGITGMGGIGKTSIARVAYEHLSPQYEGSSFLANVREVHGKKGLLRLQEKLLSKVLNAKKLNIQDVREGSKMISRWLCRKKVFLVLDDVDQSEQLERLVGKLEWFGFGSRVVITTRDTNLLISHGINYIYRVEGLSHDESIQLLYSKAFKRIQPTDDHVRLSYSVVHYANGLPLALEVLGSLLRDRNVIEWRSELEILQQTPDEKILKVLRVSYDGLTQMEKQIFLDIACFFKGKDKDRIIEIVDSCGFGPKFGINRLTEKSLITISANRVWMHDLLQEMGWEIVRERRPSNPGKWSRLWRYEDIYNVFTKNMATQAIEGIVFDKPEVEITKLNGKAFSAMKNLRLLKISNVHLYDELEYLSNDLRVLKWLGYPLDSLPQSFEPKELLKLNMCKSRIQYLWSGKKSFEKLKTINLNHSHNLIRTPDFTEVPILERLDLEDCTSLLEVHQSVVGLQKLKVLNLKDCKNLVSFPSNVSGLKSLKVLNLYGCSKLDKLPQNLGEVECLEELDISDTAIREVPCSIVMLNSLTRLSLHGCKGEPPKTWISSLFSLFFTKQNPNSMCMQLPLIASLRSLKKLDLSDCNFSEGANLDDLVNLSLLEDLNLSNNSFVSLPSKINQLSKLQILHLKKCQRLQSLPELPPRIVFVAVQDCYSLETLMNSLQTNTSRFISLYLPNCYKLVDNQGKGNNLAVMLVKRWLERLGNRSCQFHIFLPGSEIPDWFGHHRDTNEVKISLPLNWLNSGFVGFIISGVFTLSPHQDEQLEIRIALQMNTGDTFIFCIPSFTTMESDHLYLSFLSRDLFLRKVNVDSLSSCTHMRAIFISDGQNSCVKRCGIRVVYKQDLDHFHFFRHYHLWPGAQDLNEVVSIFKRSNIRNYYQKKTLVERSTAGEYHESQTHRDNPFVYTYTHLKNISVDFTS